jgi:hypothetical protein
MVLFWFAANIWALDGPRYIVTSSRPGTFALVENGSAAAVRVDAADHPGEMGILLTGRRQPSPGYR